MDECFSPLTKKAFSLLFAMGENFRLGNDQRENLAKLMELELEREREAQPVDWVESEAGKTKLVLINKYLLVMENDGCVAVPLEKQYDGENMTLIDVEWNEIDDMVRFTVNDTTADGGEKRFACHYRQADFWICEVKAEIKDYQRFASEDESNGSNFPFEEADEDLEDIFRAPEPNGIPAFLRRRRR